MDILSVDDLVVRYGPIVAVQDVSFSVEQGEIVALLGANGAGQVEPPERGRRASCRSAAGR